MEELLCVMLDMFFGLYVPIVLAMLGLADGLPTYFQDTTISRTAGAWLLLLLLLGRKKRHDFASGSLFLAWDLAWNLFTWLSALHIRWDSRHQSR